MPLFIVVQVWTYTRTVEADTVDAAAAAVGSPESADLLVHIGTQVTELSDTTPHSTADVIRLADSVGDINFRH